MIPVEIAKYFHDGTLLSVAVLSVAAFLKWQNRDARQMVYDNRSAFELIIIVLSAYSILIGYRPLISIFGDTANYAHTYGWLNPEDVKVEIGKSEWLYQLFTAVCAQFVDVSMYFTLIMFMYMFFALGGIIRIFKNNTYGALLFYMGAFSFFSYATNGIRNGWACAAIILALSFVATEKKNYLLYALFCIVGISIHKSTALPILCSLVSLRIKNPKPLIYFWLISIILSVVARGPIEGFFSSLGFDDRLSGYLQSSDNYVAQGNKGGFRLDFLLYSFMPIWLGLTVNAKTGGKNLTYNFLLSTYILANSFWVMMMNAAFSNRFAYLSWFLYPIVIAYPCLRMNVWGKKQGYVAGIILLIHTGFTLFMNYIYY